MEKRDRDLMTVALFIVIVVAGVILIALAVVQQASAGQVEIKIAIETTSKPVRGVSGDRGIDWVIPIPEIAPNYRDPGDPAPLVGSCPDPDYPDFCYKDGGHP